MNEDRYMEGIDKSSNFIQTLDTVNKNMNEMENKLGKVTGEFNALQDEMKRVILDTKNNGLILNAKQSIMMLQNEYDSKYKYRDNIRRRVNGLIQSVDINSVKKTTIETIGEESIINNPDYWLSPALLALCSWYSDNKEIAYNSLQEALSRDAEMTSLLFCFIHLRAGRVNTAIKWLNKYLGMQSPSSIDKKIVIVMDAMANGVFPNEMQDICLSKFNEWLLSLNGFGNIRDKIVNRWEDYFNKVIVNSNANGFNYIDKYVKDKNLLLSFYNRINSNNLSNNRVNDILKKQVDKNTTSTKKIDKLLNMLIFDYDNEEQEIKNNIYKNKCIIDCNGDTEKANAMYLANISMIDRYNDFYSHLTNLVIDENDPNINYNTIKLSISLLKDFIVAGYRRTVKFDEIKKIKTINIKMGNFNVTTYNGSNQNELVNELMKFLDKEFYNDIHNVKLINYFNIIVTVAGLISIFLCLKYFIVVLIIILCIGTYNAITIFGNYKKRKVEIDKIDTIKNAQKKLLLNVITEIVDYWFDINSKEEEYNNLINCFSTLNPNDYFIKSIDDNHRNIIKGDFNE